MRRSADNGWQFLLTTNDTLHTDSHNIFTRQIVSSSDSNDWLKVIFHKTWGQWVPSNVEKYDDQPVIGRRLLQFSTLVNTEYPIYGSGFSLYGNRELQIVVTKNTIRSRGRLFSVISPVATLSHLSSCLTYLYGFCSLAWRVAKSRILFSKCII